VVVIRARGRRRAARCRPLTQNGGWFRATGTFANVATDGGSPGFDSSGGGFLAGFDRQGEVMARVRCRADATLTLNII
jgi:uncharacterized protein with beta-barrel porin domain